MITLKKTDPHLINHLRAQCERSACAPLDDMWALGIIAKSDHYTISDGQTLGYFVVDNQNTLLQFFIAPVYAQRLGELFSYVLSHRQISHAHASTYDPVFHSLCLDHHQSAAVHSVLYTQGNEVRIAKPLQSIREVCAHIDDIEAAITYSNAKAGLGGAWLEGYYRQLIAAQGLYLYNIADEIVGTGEFRPSHRGDAYANIGMTVSSDYRKRNIGTYILSRMRALANKRGYTAVCGTSVENIPSQRTISKCGFAAYHRVMRFTF